MVRGESQGSGGRVQLQLSPRSCSSLRALSCSISFVCVVLNSASVVCNCAFIPEPMRGWSGSLRPASPARLSHFPAPQLSSLHQAHFLQQFLQAPTSSFRALNIIFCSEAGMNSPPNTLGQGTLFSNPGSAPFPGVSSNSVPSF